MSITGAFNSFPLRFLFVVLKDPLPSQLSPALKLKYLPATRFVTSPRPACSVDQVKSILGGDFDTGESGVFRGAIRERQRSYSRATIFSLPLTQSHSAKTHKSLTILFESCEVRTNIGERDMASNQIPSSAPQSFRAIDVLAPGR